MNSPAKTQSTYFIFQQKWLKNKNDQEYMSKNEI